MNYLIALNHDKSEFSYQALDYYRLFDGFIEPSAAPNVSEYIKNPRTMALDKARALTILAFRPLLFDEIRTIHDDNKIIYFNNDDPHPNLAIVGNAMHCFIAFGHRTAYKLANYLSSMNIDRPVYRIMPWVDTTGIKEYDKPPLGKISGNSDMGIRPMLRLMAAGAIVVVPNHSPFTDVIVDRWNGIIRKDDAPDFINIGLGIKDIASEISMRSKQFAHIVTSKEHYIEEFRNTINGITHNYNEPWIKINQTMGNEWVIPKETIDSGVEIRIPRINSDKFKIMKPLSLEQLLNIFVSMRFKKVYVFDAIVEEVNNDNIGLINRSLKMLGDRARDIIFCFDPPDKWRIIMSKLTFMRPSEAEKQVI